MLITLAGSFTLLISYLPYAASPLLTVTGVALLCYATYIFLRGNDLSGTGKTPTYAAVPCQDANHAGCQDDPECVCGCHRERIEIMIRSY